MEDYYLVENPPRQTQFGNRRGEYAGIQVVHTTESTRRNFGDDNGALNVARFIANRTSYGSYHTLVDSQNIVRMIPLIKSAYHCRGWNSATVGLSVACQAALWGTYPDNWVDAALDNLARAALEVNNWAKANGYPETPARLITADEGRRGVKGFTSHARLDPGRRTDPGPSFPWNQFLSKYGHYKLNGVSKPMPSPDPFKQPNDHSRAVQIALNGAARILEVPLDSLLVDGFIGGKSADMARAVEARAKRVKQEVTQIQAPPAPRDALPHEVAAVEAMKKIRDAVQILP